MQERKRGLSNEILTGILWTAWGKGAKTILQFLVLAILARLMTPLEFGIIGAAMIVIGFSEIITHVGLGPAIVQRAELEPRHLHTAFSVSLLLSAAVSVLIWLAAPLIAGFFQYEGIEPVIRVLSLLFLIKGLSLVGESLAQRDLDFKLLANGETVSFVVGYFLFGVTLAVLDFNVWALVAAHLVTATVKTTILLWKYPPKGFWPDRQSFNELIYFGGGYTVARIANQFALQGDNLVVGRWLGLTALGLYGRAYQLMSVPAQLFGQVLDQVLFPSMAKMQDDRERLAKAYLRGVTLIALVMLPVSVIAFILAPEIVRALLGHQWSAVVLPFRILIIGLLMRTSYKMSDSLARATGAVYHRAWRQAIYAGLVVGGAFVGQFWGVAGVALGVLGAVTINFLLMAQMSLRIVGAGWWSFLKAHQNAVSLAAFAALITFPAAELLRRLDFSSYVLLGVMALFIGACFLFIIRFAPTYFLGHDGVWMLSFLNGYVRNKFSGYNSARGEDIVDKTAGAGDTRVESA